MRRISDRARAAYQMLRAKGYNHLQSAALVGNLMQESGWDINTGAVGDGGNSFGAVQWNGPRMRAYKAFAQDRGVDATDLQAQMDYLDHELNTSEASARKAFMSGKDLDEMTVLASSRFWRPGDPRENNRKRYAHAVASQMGHAAPRGIPPEPMMAGLDAAPIPVPRGMRPEASPQEPRMAGLDTEALERARKRRMAMGLLDLGRQMMGGYYG